MEQFFIGKEFSSWDEVLDCKNMYEKANNSILTIANSHKMKADRVHANFLQYERVILICKAGPEPERKSVSQGVRLTETTRMNCPFEIRIGSKKGKIILYFIFFIPPKI